MQVTQTAVDGLRHEFKVVLSAQDIEAKITDRLTQLGSQVRVPGFRPGKVPLAILKKRYGDSVLGEVVERAVADSSQQAITSQGLRPALRPKIEITSFEKGSNLEYKLAIEVLPKVEPMDFTTLALERLVAEVTATEEDEALERLAAQYKRSEPAPAGHTSAKGDIAVIDFKGTIAGQDFPGGTSEGYYLELGAGQFIPGFEEQLEGLGTGAGKTVEVTFPANYALRGPARQGRELRGDAQGNPSADREPGRRAARQGSRPREPRSTAQERARAARARVWRGREGAAQALPA